MIITKQLEAEIIQFLDTYWEKYITGDFDTWSTFLMNEYKNIGTNQEEIWLNKKEILDYSLSMADQLIGQLKINNKTTHVYPLDPYILAHEFGDMFIKVEGEWVFYAKLRLSSILQQTDTGWKVLHQHGSFPDAKTDDGEFLAFEDISRENSELRDAIKRRTAELEIKNRELEIEAALDRVRARSMAMHKSEELAETAYVLFQEFRSLENTSGQATIGIMNEAEGNMELWLTVHGNQMNRSLDVPLDEPIVIQKLYKGWKAGEKSIVIDLNKKDLEEYNKFRNSLSDVNFKTQEVENRRVIQVAFFSHGVISLASPEPNSDSSLHLLSRFANVFEHNYRRFLDLQKAEAQAREAQIELALEKVRARTMAMHKSDELHDVAEVLFQQLRNFGGDLWGSGIGLCTSESEEDSFWFVNEKGILPTVSIPHTEDPTHRKLFEGWQNNESLVVDTRDGKELSSHYTYMLSIPSVKGFFQGILDAGLSFPTWQRWHAANFSNGYLLLITTSPYAHEELLVRFAKAFEQAYIRFLDLQKAEAQAREAQIEHALEKVRARTMAMQHSEELPDAANVLFLEIQALGIPAWSAGYNILSDDKKSSTCIMSSEGEIQTPFILPLTEHASLRPWHEAILQELPFFVYQQGGKELVEHYEYMATIPGLEEVFQQFADAGISLPTFQVNHLCRFTNGFLLFITYEQVPDAHDIFNRFAAVFQQTYTRFLDLQKAEAQAREAQIEAALEKVRSRSLAMHRSNELNEVVAILFEKLKELQIPATAVGLGIAIEGSKDLDAYVCGENEDGLVITNYRLPFFDNIISKDLINTLEKQLDYFVGKYSKEEKNSFYNYLFEHSAIKDVPDDIKSMIIGSPTYTISMVAVKNTVFNVNDFEGNVLAKNEVDIIKRFAKVFEQAYTRFLDLQKAEAQAKKSKIELSLERVRAKSMAMQSSDELHEVLAVLFQQFNILGINPVFAHLSLMDLENSTFTYRMTGRMGQKVLTEQVIDLNAREEWKGIVEAFKSEKPESVSCLHFPKEEVPQIWELFDETFSSLPEGAKIYQKDFPAGIYNTQGFCKFGYIGFNHNRAATEQEKDIVVRFAKEFGRLYQRFLDIQKAEAQAREAQIQLSLERVRAKSMAMQSSDELHEVLSVLFQQFDRLGIEPINVFLSLFDRKARTLTYRASGKSGTRMPGKQVVKVDSMEPLRTLYDKWINDNSDSVEVIYYPKEVLPQLFGIFDETFAAMPEEDRMVAQDYPNGGYSIAGYTPFGYLGYDHEREATEEEKDILSRFCIEFSRVYQRFLDIQKAEAQAREAQIEASLERIRTRSMAMHASEELNDVLSVLFQQIEVLGIDAKSAHLTLMDVENNKFSFRITGKSGATNIGEQIIDLDAMPIWKDTVTNWKKAKLHSHQCLVYPPEMLPDLWKLIDESLKRLPAKERIKIKDFPNGVFDCEGHTKFGYIGFNNSRPPTEEEISIVIRFAREFERVYQRFIDIEKAEAQAREAQIEASLERVRAASMAMHQSTELHEVVLKVSEEISNLGLNIHATHLYRWDEKDLKGLNVWFASVDGVSPNEVYWPYFKHSIFDGIESARKKGKILFTALLNKSEKNSLYRHLINKTSIEVPPERQDFALKAEGVAFSIALGKNAGIAILRFTKEAFHSEENEILIRFTNVFEQAFTRFLDLQKAEEQTREAQIQLSLERVRARSMAMHSSEELNEVLSILFQQFDVLGITPINVWLSLLDEEKGTFTYRSTGTSGSRTFTQQVIAFNAMDIWQEVLDQWKSGTVEPVLVTHYPAERLPEVFEVFKETFMAMPEKERINITAFPNGFYNIQGYCRFGYIGYNHINPPSEEQKDLVTKFAREFERVYQRFLDIEKAEAQTKEAQIEAALERVRAASMAMHQTEDIGIVVQVYFEQLKYLEIPFEQAWITILKLEEGYFDTWFSPIDGIYDKPTHFKMPSAPFEDTAIKNWKAGVPLSYMSLKTRSEVDQFLSACDEMTNSKYFTHSQKKRNNNKLEFLEARHKFGFISKTTKEAPTKEDEEILMRFASVFEQTYTRFLDIQKAEAQAREAQIEAALEKVRSRSLAMQSAEELQEVVTIVGEKLQELGVILDSGGVVICTYFPDSKDVLHWTANFDASFPSVPYYLPYFDTPIWRETWHSKFETDDDFFEKVYSFEDKNHFFHYAFKHSDYKNLPDEYKKALLESETHALSFAWQTNSALMVASHTGMLLPTEHKIILKRFAKVFEQAYIRFMDLEKAEKQTRESQIELALERVRAKAMAMRQSEELTEVLPVIFEQLDGLGVKTVWTHLTLMDMEKNTFTYRMTGREGKRVFAEQVVDMDASEIWQNAVEAFKAEEPDSIVRFYFPPDATSGYLGNF